MHELHRTLASGLLSWLISFWSQYVPIVLFYSIHMTFIAVVFRSKDSLVVSVLGLANTYIKQNVPVAMRGWELERCDIYILHIHIIWCVRHGTLPGVYTSSSRLLGRVLLLSSSKGGSVELERKWCYPLSTHLEHDKPCSNSRSNLFHLQDM